MSTRISPRAGALACLTVALLASSAVLASQLVTQPALKAAFLFRRHGQS